MQEAMEISLANEANDQEHTLTFWAALRLYPKGIFWAFAMATAVIMEGYDTKLIGTLYAQPAFQKAYGHRTAKGTYQISAPWQAGLNNGGAVGQFAGLLIAGYLSERYGFRRTMLVGQGLIIAFIFITFFSPNLKVLEVGLILFGVPLGFFQATSVIYALELGPLPLRAYLTNYIHQCWAFGQLLAIGVLRGLLSRTDEWAYRIPFAIQWVWPVILIPLIYLAPESPWWLVRRNRLQEARDAVKRLTSPKNVDFDIDKNIALMVVTTEHELAVEASTTYWTCFQGTNLRRTIVVMFIYCIQTLNGNPLRGYSTYFFEQAGLQTTQAFNMSIIGFAVAIVGGLSSWAFLPLAGRRTIYLIGLAIMTIIMALIGGLGIPQAHTPKSDYSWAIGSLLVISSFVYYSTIGPLTNTFCGEIPTAMLRSKSIALARSLYIISTIIANTLTPYQLNPTAWNWGAKTGFFWMGGCVISIVFAWFCIPETKDRTTAEVDYLFETKVSARKFSKTPVAFTAAVSNIEK
ncbi:uncharacterized protein MYCFIDRAFT_136338 [Pseudocercospora fijiensis CIRAD86]|uniref:Major facilitator superfamily (MFS) profile domain-containing protein n=1 Tax=Pseudocercospora fijiensis (strain CIRAD86) TaxID=383855 RepID=M2ZV83_PSEFD|nr:uncharacterized protein MYCFIDRAFT_136338 [Pseudocercospora fijiensis CIRAD86]EME82914.1 hypothetical protein MYCFIDRAFT_136338 [Pseudocercospora fijiensis CIRAD86]